MPDIEIRQFRLQSCQIDNIVNIIQLLIFFSLNLSTDYHMRDTHIDLVKCDMRLVVHHVAELRAARLAAAAGVRAACTI